MERLHSGVSRKTRLMRKLLLSLGLLLAFSVLLCAINRKNTAVPGRNNAAAEPSRIRSLLPDKAKAARSFARKNGFNASVAFLIDMSEEAGKNRFFVYDLVGDSVRLAGLVTHGRCNKMWLSGRQYGNTIGCGCTSIGKYKVGNPYKGRFGDAYKLHGLDPSNSNAYARFVVLHSHECVPESPVHPNPICQSDGCPTVSAGFLRLLQKEINRSPKPVLLWIYDSQKKLD